MMARPTLHLLALTLLTLTSTLVTAQRSAYGEACNKTLKCDRRSFLTCTPDGSCDCTRPDEMLYDSTSGKCVSRAGEACKFIRAEQDSDNSVMYEMTPCVPNADCSSDGFCSCDSRHFENVNGTCSLSQSHLQPCNSQLKCSQFSALHCGEGGICQCDQSAIYRQDIEQCVGLASKPCINAKCTDGATCDASYTCSCNSAHFPNDQGLCRAKVGLHKNCTNSNQCQLYNGRQLTCENGICDCDPTYSRYGAAQRHSNYINSQFHDGVRYRQSFYRFEGEVLIQCLGLAGSPCLDRLCVTGGYCSHDKSYTQTGECFCRPEYTKSKLGNCGLGINAACQRADDCIDGLVCKQKKCACQYSSQIFDDESKSCLSRVGGPCTGNGTGHCVKDALCQFSGDGDLSGHCVCWGGFVENAEGLCDVMYGQPCFPLRFCDRVGGLVCVNGVCGCTEFSQYSQGKRKCVGRVGAKCGVQEDEMKTGNLGECVEGGECEMIHPKVGGRCVCKRGWNETDEYTCEEVKPVEVVEEVLMELRNESGNGIQKDDPNPGFNVDVVERDDDRYFRMVSDDGLWEAKLAGSTDGVEE